MERIPVILDGDPGADDSLGILMALSCDRLEVLGITSVCGNTTSRQTAENATKVCALAGREDIPVYCGANQPLNRELKFSTKYSGMDGLCDTGLAAKPEMISELSAKDFLIQTLKHTEEPVTIIFTAGFTNLAEALKEEPEIRRGIKEVVAASGYFGLNTKKVRAEWNILVDPEAAEIVYNSGIPVRSVGLDVTCMLEDSHVEQTLAKGSGAYCDFLKRCDAFNKKSNLHPYSLFVDGMAVASAIRPELAEYTTGRAVVHPEKKDADLIEFIPGEGNIRAAHGFDFETYFEMIRGLITQ